MNQTTPSAALVLDVLHHQHAGGRVRPVFVTHLGIRMNMTNQIQSRVTVVIQCTWSKIYQNLYNYYARSMHQQVHSIPLSQ